VRTAGAKIRKQFKNPVGIGLAQEIDTAMAMRTVMYAFGGSEQNESGQLALNSKQTLEAIKFVKALHQEAMTPEVFTWDASSNNRAMVAAGSRWRSTPSPSPAPRRRRTRRCRRRSSSPRPCEARPGRSAWST
jgi:hypothetical protein